MIFVTVGTHEQPFNRLVEYMDNWAYGHEEEVVIQIGSSTYMPRWATYRKMYSYADMDRMNREARIVITHGGPSSFLIPLSMGKTPIVVPRKKEYGEHINDHQVSFCNALIERKMDIVVIDNVYEIEGKIDLMKDRNPKGEFLSNNMLFCEALGRVVNGLI